MQIKGYHSGIGSSQATKSHRNFFYIIINKKPLVLIVITLILIFYCLDRLSPIFLEHLNY